MGPENQSSVCKGCEVVNQLRIHLNPCMNDEKLPLTYNYYIEKYHLGFYSAGVYNKEGIYICLVSILMDYQKIMIMSKSEYIKLCMIQYNINIPLILEYDRYCIILDALYQICDIK